MKPSVLVGLEPSVLEEVKTKLSALGWNIVIGEPTAEAVDKTVFVTDRVPEPREAYNTVATGVNFSPDATADTICEQLVQERGGTPGERAEEASIVDATPGEKAEETSVADEAANMPKETENETVSPDSAEAPDAEAARKEEADRELARQKKQDERNRNAMAFLLS